MPSPRNCASTPTGSFSKRSTRPRRCSVCAVAPLGSLPVSTLRVVWRWTYCGSVSETPIGVAQAPAASRTPISVPSARALLDRIPTPRQARRVGLLVVAVGGLLLGLCLLGGLRRRAVVSVLSHRARGAADGGAHRCTLAGITGDGAADGPDRGTPRRPMHCSALLWRRRGGGLRRCGRIEARLLLGPVVTLVLVLLERILALPRLGVDVDLGLRRAHERTRDESGNDRGCPALHARPP